VPQPERLEHTAQGSVSLSLATTEPRSRLFWVQGILGKAVMPSKLRQIPQVVRAFSESPGSSPSGA